jgi:hypothetical protein
MATFRTPRVENLTPRVIEATPRVLRGSRTTECFSLNCKGLPLVSGHSEASCGQNYPGGRGA